MSSGWAATTIARSQSSGIASIAIVTVLLSSARLLGNYDRHVLRRAAHDRTGLGPVPAHRGPAGVAGPRRVHERSRRRRLHRPRRPGRRPDQVPVPGQCRRGGRDPRATGRRSVGPHGAARYREHRPLGGPARPGAGAVAGHYSDGGPPAYDSPLSAGAATWPRRAPRPRSETKKMASPMAIDTTVIAPTARAHPDLVKIGAHGAQKSRKTAAASAKTPTAPHTASTPHGVRWASLNFSGNARRTKNTSLNSSTIDVHHTTVTPASSAR